MRQFISISANAFMELIRQPVFLLLMTTSALFSVFLACVPYFGFGEDPKLVKDSVLALMFLSGLLGAVLSASASLAREIRAGTALAVLSKPVSRAKFILAKYAGLAGALTVLTYVNTVAALVASRMAFDAYGWVDLHSLTVFSGFVVLAYLLGGVSNYFLRRPFVSDAVLYLVLMVTLAFVAINFMERPGSGLPGQPVRLAGKFGEGIDWRMTQVALLILFAVWILAGLALACSTRLEMIPTMSVCSFLFLVGLMSDYLFGRSAEAGSWWASALYTVVPNWQLFWLADALETGAGSVPWAYLGRAFLYMVCYVGAALSAALLLFEDRELS